MLITVRGVRCAYTRLRASCTPPTSTYDSVPRRHCVGAQHGPWTPRCSRRKRTECLVVRVMSDTDDICDVASRVVVILNILL